MLTFRIRLLSLLPPGRPFLVICDHRFVVGKLDDGVGVERFYTVECVKGVQEGAQNTALGCSGVKDEGGSLGTTDLNRFVLWILK